MSFICCSSFLLPFFQGRVFFSQGGGWPPPSSGKNRDAFSGVGQSQGGGSSKPPRRNFFTYIFLGFCSFGRYCIEGIFQGGATILGLFWFAIQCVAHSVVGPFYGKIFFSQLARMIFLPLPLIGCTSLFTGMVLAIQTYAGFSSFGDEVPKIVALSFVKELGPVLCALMMAGYWTSSIAAEIATMKVGEQIDALKTLSIQPICYLVVPRILAGVIALPFLAFIADGIGMLGGYLIGVYQKGVYPVHYLMLTGKSLSCYGILWSLLKASAFGFLLTFIGCYEGYYAKDGSQGVAKATTQGVVRACFAVLLVNYLMTIWLPL